MKLIKNNEIIEKKSKFLGYFYQIDNSDDINMIIKELKNEHAKASHFCYAARIDSPFFEKTFDDGEPSGTAGRPILSVLQKRDIKNVCIVIVRYFGGIKLGASGLLRAYSKTASALCNQ